MSEGFNFNQLHSVLNGRVAGIKIPIRMAMEGLCIISGDVCEKN